MGEALVQAGVEELGPRAGEHEHVGVECGGERGTVQVVAVVTYELGPGDRDLLVVVRTSIVHHTAVGAFGHDRGRAHALEGDEVLEHPPGLAAERRDEHDVRAEPCRDAGDPEALTGRMEVQLGVVLRAGLDGHLEVGAGLEHADRAVALPVARRCGGVIHVNGHTSPHGPAYKHGGRSGVLRVAQEPCGTTQSIERVPRVCPDRRRLWKWVCDGPGTGTPG